MLPPLRPSFLLLLAGLALPRPQDPGDAITESRIRADVLFLSSDALEGRDPGSRGGALAAEYIRSRFVSLGLQAVGGSYFQEVPLTGVTPDPVSLALTFEVDDGPLPALYPAEAVIWPGAARTSTEVEAEVVFVGYGIDAPDWRWDDFAGRRLAGKVLLFLVGEPPAPPHEPDLFDGRALTYYGRWSYKIEQARRLGAAGALVIHDRRTAGYDWGVVTSSWTGERLLPAEPGSPPPVPLQGWLSNPFARGLLRGAGLDLDELALRAARRDFRPIPTGVTVRARMESRIRPVTTRNVAGYLPGTHPERGDEVVVLTAHYDHLGVGQAVRGDSIYNGAYDNASGVALLLAVARAFSLLEDVDRGILFLATTAEEEGLLGAEHYVRQPLLPLEGTVAALNVDGANLWGVTDDVIVPGVDRSTLGRVLRSRASTMGMRVRPDPAPEEGHFFRSDHFAFARAGVPVLYLQHGLDFRGRPAGWGNAMMARWALRHYHRPSDELDPAADLAGAVQQGRLLFAVARDIADGSEAPRWTERATRFFPGPRR